MIVVIINCNYRQLTMSESLHAKVVTHGVVMMIKFNPIVPIFFELCNKDIETVLIAD